MSTSRLAARSVFGGKYEITGVLGEGASGIVYDATRAPDAAAARPRTRVALKVLHGHLVGSPQVLGRFRREARILTLLDGQNLVRLVDFVEENGAVGIALAFVDGDTLDAWIAKNGPPSPEAAVEIMLQVCAALGVAHAAGVVHRDLKPANVLVERGGPGARRVRVVDFGLAKLVHGERMVTGLTEHDMIFGTPEYMAPEQARGEDVDGRCDLYAAGVMLYELVTGRVPFKARTPMAVLTAHLSEPPKPPRSACVEGRDPSAISPALEAVILRALAKDRAARFESARELAEALAATLGGRHVVGSSLVPHADVATLASSDTDLALERPFEAPRAFDIADAPTASAAGATGTTDAAPITARRAAAAQAGTKLFWAIAIAIATAAIVAGVVIGAR